MPTDEVTAREAAQITGLGERTIRRMLADGRIHARKIAPNRYAIPVRNLPTRKADRVADLERQLADLRRRVEALEHGHTSATLEGIEGFGRQAASPAANGYAVASWSLPTTAEEPKAGAALHPAYSASLGTLPEYFRDKSARGLWLERHGINASTSRGWRECPMGPPRDILKWAYFHLEAVSWRGQGSRLRHCTEDPLCPCHTMVIPGD